tara:strand:+ start:474 stop:1181 length:708 start_codon:yes stop_codon:yes gene_type:complete
MKIGEVDYTNLTDEFGYWTVKVEDIGDYLPIKIKDRADDYNPFIGWKISDDVEKFIEDTVRKIAVPDDAEISKVIPWGNYFDRFNYYYHKFHHVPHVDYPGWVGNLWLSEHPEGSRGTQFYNYKDDWKRDRFDFPRPEELLEQYETSWQQWEISKVESYGFEYMGTAPAVKNTITIYNSCVPHKAFIGDDVNRSWSQLVQISKRRFYDENDDNMTREEYKNLQDFLNNNVSNFKK